MKTTITVFMLATALLLAGCGAPATNTNTTANTNTAPASPAAPAVDALVMAEKKAHEAYIHGDATYFEGFLSDKFMMMGNKGEHHTKADLLKMVGGVKCDVKDGWTLDKPEMAKIDKDTYVLSYTTNMQGSCTSNGHTEKMDKPVRMASIYVRGADNKWLGAWHGETEVMAPQGEAKKEEAKPDAKKDEAKKEEPKKDEAKKADVATSDALSTSDVKSKETAKDAKPDAKAPATEKPAESKPATADPNTDALVKIHQSGWEGWRDKDAAKLTSLTTADLSWVSPEGGFMGTKDAVIKGWTTQDCKDVKTVKVSDGFAAALSPTVELLFAKGTADGTCNGMKNGSLWNAAVYVKEGNDWKLSFLFESPAK